VFVKVLKSRGAVWILQMQQSDLHKHTRSKTSSVGSERRSAVRKDSPRRSTSSRCVSQGMADRSAYSIYRVAATNTAIAAYGGLLAKTLPASTRKHSRHHLDHLPTTHGQERKSSIQSRSRIALADLSNIVRHGDTQAPSRDGTDSRAASLAWASRRWHLQCTAVMNISS
jgi:hypothetical protein